MIKKTIAVFTVLFMMTINLSAATTSGSPTGCWTTANAAEINTCGSVGCDFELWDFVYYACMEYEQ